MLWLVLGALTLFLFLGGLRAFESASVTTIKSLLGWIAALGGITLALLLVLTGREGIALGALAMFGPLIWQRWQAYRASLNSRPNRAQSSRANDSDSNNQQPPPRRSAGGMTRDEAYQVLGLHPGASEAEIRAAHHRLMRSAHPDSGGSDWLATRINLARDVLLQRSKHTG
jgi:DnaJ family protein C protein 19